jgi:diguanylate cyclase (GGDEF)-like protein/PAS domain S-box-containing protein
VSQAQAILSHSVSAGFLAIGLASLAGWLRHRDQAHARFAAALSLLGITAFLAELSGPGIHGPRVLLSLLVLAFLGSGAALLTLRSLFMPLRSRTRIAAAVALASVAALDLVELLLTPMTSTPSPLAYIAGLSAIAAWVVCVSEPAVRFWIASRGRPAVQRARLRALSAGYLGIVVALIGAVAAGESAGAITDIVALFVVPCLYVSFAPPQWLRRQWRAREERAFQPALDDLLLYSPDRATLARRALQWALRLVGGDAGALVASDGAVLAVEGSLPDQAAALSGDDRGPGPHAMTFVLPCSDGPVTLTVLAGQYSPLFGSEEIAGLEQYAASVTLALDRVLLSEEMDRRQGQLEAVVDAINDMGEGLLLKQNGKLIYANEAYQTLTTRAPEIRVQLEKGEAAASESRERGVTSNTRREIEVFTTDGRRIHLETAVRTLNGSSGRLSIAMVRDVSDRKRAEQALAEQARLLEFTHDAILVRTMGPQSVVRFWSRGAEKAYGWSSADMMGRDPHEILNTAFPKPVAEIEADILRHGEWEGELVHQRRDGTSCIMASRWALTIDNRGVADGILEVNRDITDRHRTESIRGSQLAVGRALAQSETMDDAAPAILSALCSNLDWQVAEMWLLDPTEESLTLRHWWHTPGIEAAVFEQAARRLALHRGQDLAGRAWEAGKPECVADVVADPACQRRGLAAVLGLHGAAVFPIAVDQKVIGAVTLYSHRTRVLDDEILQPLADLGRQMGGFLERKRTETALEQTVERLEQLAATDPLTGLNNRRAFERALSTVPVEPFAVLAIDVDNLKPVNDEFGHEAGDVILQAVAMALASLVRDRDVVARVGGDEFAVLLPGAHGREAAAVAERMRAAMHAISVPYGRARISIGWTAAPAGADARAVWRATDELLYEAKSSGRDCVAGEDYQDRARPASAGSNDADLVSRVLSDEQVNAVFQPIVNLETGAVLGYEALARPAGHAATASVEALFAAARRLGRIRDLDWLCRRAAVRAARMLPGSPLLFLNVSAVAFLDPVHPVDQLLLLLNWAEWSAEQTVLEITEKEAMRDVARVRMVVAAYREHGVRFAIDDVGEGHSTLELLAATNPEFIKIAGGLSAQIADSGQFSAMQAALAFARSSRTQVIAEGIETDDVAEKVRGLGIQLGQGYLLGLPAPAQEHAQPHVTHRVRRRRNERTSQPD